MHLVAARTYTLKTHKSHGNVVFWIIHDCSRSPLGCFSGWVMSKLREPLSRYSHIARDTRGVLEQLWPLNIPGAIIMMKGDITEDYMSGEHEMLAEAAGKMVEPSIRSMMYDAVLYILQHQYVADIVGDDDIRRVFQVIRGSGMGSRASGEIADACFIVNVESKITQAYKEQNGIFILWEMQR